MPRTKLKRIIGIKELCNVFSLNEHDVQSSITKYFGSSSGFTLEIGCGNGDYSVELARRFPEKNFIGVDVKAARIFNGAVKAVNLKLHNVAFVISRAERLIEIFPEKSIEEIYIPFPDPHIRRANHYRRLISPRFLKIYNQLLADDGRIHFKTDNRELYEYAIKTISEFGCKIVFETKNLYDIENEMIDQNVQTSFESHYVKQGRVIRYISFRF